MKVDSALATDAKKGRIKKKKKYCPEKLKALQ